MVSERETRDLNDQGAALMTEPPATLVTEKERPVILMVEGKRRVMSIAERKRLASSMTE
jgi:hypothetical protein